MGTTVSDEPPGARSRPSPPDGASNTPPRRRSVRSQPRRRRGARRDRTAPAPMLVMLCAIVVLPIVVVTALSLTQGWTPVGDNATIALRTGDVLRGDPPMTGMPTTANTITDRVIDHPGPLEMWVAAVPYALAGPIGLVITVAAVNAAALVASVAIGWRRGGPPLAVGVTAMGLVLCWALGSTVIRDPLNSHIGLLPWFALVLLCWDVRLGSWRSLPVAVVAASWVTQAHVVAVPMVAVVALGTVGLCIVDHLRRSAAERRRFARGRRRALIWSVVLGFVVNVPLLVDQAWGSANLSKMLSFAGAPGQGAGAGARALVATLGAPPAWLRPANEPFALLRSPTVLDAAAFAVTAGLFAWVYTEARRRRDRGTVALLDAGLLAAVGGLVVLSRTPIGGAVLAADPMLLLRPTTAIVGLGLGWGAWQIVAERTLARCEPVPVRRAAMAVGSLAALALVTITVTAPERFGGFGDGLMGPIGALQPDIEAAVEGQPMVQVNATGWAARLYLRHSVIENLERHGTATRTGDEERSLRRSGRDRPAPTATLWVVTDPVEPESPAPGAVLVARGDLVAGGDRSDAARRRRQLRNLLDGAGTVQLRDTDRFSVRDVSREYFRWKTPPEANTLPADWVSVDAFVDLQRHGLVASPVLDPNLVAAIADDSIGRYFASDDMEVAIYLRRE